MGWITGVSGVDSRQVQIFFPCPEHRVTLWSPPSFLYTEYPGACSPMGTNYTPPFPFLLTVWWYCSYSSVYYVTSCQLDISAKLGWASSLAASWFENRHPRYIYIYIYIYIYTSILARIPAVLGLNSSLPLMNAFFVPLLMCAVTNSHKLLLC